MSATAGILGFGVATSSGRAKRAKGALSLGTHIVRQACLAAGLEVLDLEADPSAARSASVVMAGLFWWEHLPEFILQAKESQARNVTWLELNQDIDVTVGSKVAA